MKKIFDKIFGNKRKEEQKGLPRDPEDFIEVSAGWGQKKKIPNQRREKRYHIGVGCSIKTDSADTEKFHFVKPRDLSVNGVRFSSTHVFEVGTEVNLFFHFNTMFKGVSELKVRAKILRMIPAEKKSKEVHYGCEILHETESSEQVLRDFVDWLKNANI